MTPPVPEVETTPFAISISNNTLYIGTATLVSERYTSSNITKIKMTVTMVMLFRLELAIDRVSDAIGAGPLT